MKKIAAAFDGLKYSRSTREYAIHFAKQSGAHLVGIFLDDPSYTSYKIYELAVKEGSGETKLKQLDAKDTQTRATAAEDFKKACEKEGIHFTIHKDRNIAIQELKHETIYADLLIIDGNETFTHYTESLPTRFIRDLLGDTQCPVLVVPEKFKSVDKIVILYDGEPSSVHAVKMFSYMMPFLKHLPVEVISVKSPGNSLHLPDNKMMKEFMKRHFPKAVYTVLKGLAEEEVMNYLKNEKENAMVVLGAYRRSAVSRWFRQSMADVLMKNVKLPLFIAHNK
ncbi:MAG: universal stress protein [Chitinophagaceae bacterium]|nr:universal stress protein [Chitinophagaceae bacterium]